MKELTVPNREMRDSIYELTGFTSNSDRVQKTGRKDFNLAGDNL